MALDLAGIHNVGEFDSHHYLTALLEHDLGSTLQRWTKAEDEGGAKAPPKQLASLANRFFHWQADAAGNSEAPHADQLPKDVGAVKLATESWRELLDGRRSAARTRPGG